MDNPLITPEKEKSELQKFPLHYEHLPDAKAQNKPNKQPSEATGK